MLSSLAAFLITCLCNVIDLIIIALAALLLMDLGAVLISLTGLNDQRIVGFFAGGVIMAAYCTSPIKSVGDILLMFLKKRNE